MSKTKKIRQGLWYFKNELKDFSEKFVRLTSYDTKFFQPFSVDDNLITQVITILIAPMIGIYSLLKAFVFLLINLLEMAYNVMKLSVKDIKETFVNIIGLTISLVSTPIQLFAMTIFLVLSLFTRSFASIATCELLPKFSK